MPALISLDPATLPDIATLRQRAKALAMLDAIVSPEWEYRYFSYNASWFDGEEMASMRNGSGDEWFVHFGPFGAAIKGIAHESPLAGDRWADRSCLIRSACRRIAVADEGLLPSPDGDERLIGAGMGATGPLVRPSLAEAGHRRIVSTCFRCTGTASIQSGKVDT